MPHAPRRPLTALGTSVVAAAATLALIGGTLAQFTDTDTADPQTLTAGTVEVDLVEGASWNTHLDNLAIADTAHRQLLIHNTGTLDIAQLKLSATITDAPGDLGGRLSEATSVDIVQDPAGTSPVTLADHVRLSDLATGYDLALPDATLAAGTDVTLEFRYTLTGARNTEPGNRTHGSRDALAPSPVNPDNAYQGSRVRIAYTIDALQRPGTGAGTNTAPSPEPSPEPEPFEVPPSQAVEGQVVAWGTNTKGVTTLPTGLGPVSSVATNFSPSSYALAARTDGTVVSWGDTSAYGAKVPAGLSDVTQVAAGGVHGVALHRNGTVTSWGYSSSSASKTPVGLTDVVQIEAGSSHNLALRSDGTVVAWGANNLGQAVVPAGLEQVTAIATATDTNLALRSDGTVVAWGNNNEGQATVPAGLNGVTDIAVGSRHSLALRADGTVVAWGYNAQGQATVPAGLRNVAAIAVAGQTSLAVQQDGTVVVWGAGAGTTYAPPAAARSATLVRGGWSHFLAITP